MIINPENINIISGDDQSFFVELMWGAGSQLRYEYQAKQHRFGPIRDSIIQPFILMTVFIFDVSLPQYKANISMHVIKVLLRRAVGAYASGGD